MGRIGIHCDEVLPHLEPRVPLLHHLHGAFKGGTFLAVGEWDIGDKVLDAVTIKMSCAYGGVLDVVGTVHNHIIVLTTYLL